MSEVILVEELMVPAEEYATVSEDATLFEAIMALEKAQEDQDRDRFKYLHRAILVTDTAGKVVGKISQLTAIQALEPKYKDMGDLRSISAAGFSADFIKSMLDNFHLCDASLGEMCGKGAQIKIREFMHKPEAGECVEAEAPICEAIHQFIIGQFQSLLVVRDEEIVGILRLTDLFMKVFEIMKQCEIPE
jgi:CBS domain-containing protein